MDIARARQYGVGQEVGSRSDHAHSPAGHISRGRPAQRDAESEASPVGLSSGETPRTRLASHA
eukprot:12172358-Heterocapsa_arctica.AAC.1